MARPKSNTPNKKKLTLTVSAQSRVNLDFISKHYGKSISLLIEEWAAKEAARVARAAKKEIPDAEQCSLDDDFMTLGGILYPVED